MAKEYMDVDPWADEAEARGHNLSRDEGRIDMFAMSRDCCNGPRCETCLMSWCEHCTPADRIERCEGA